MADSPVQPFREPYLHPEDVKPTIKVEGMQQPSLNAFFQAVQQRQTEGAPGSTQLLLPGQVSALGGKGEGDVLMAQNPVPAQANGNNPNVSLFSPWATFYSSQGMNSFPFPSPSLGFTFGDTFIPWPDMAGGGMMGMTGLTPTPGATGYGAGPIGGQPNMQGSKDDASVITPVPQPVKEVVASVPQAIPQVKKQSLVDELKMEDRRDSSQSLSSATPPGSIPRIDSSSSGGSAVSVASAQIPSAAPHMPCRYSTTSGISQSSAPTASYFTYPRPGGGDTPVIGFAQQLQQPHQGSPHMAPPPQAQYYDPHSHGPNPSMYNMNTQAFQQHPYSASPFGSLPPHSAHPQSSTSIFHQQHPGTRSSTSSSVSSVSPGILNSRMPRAASPVSMHDDESIHPMSNAPSPRSMSVQVPSAGPGPSSIRHQQHLHLKQRDSTTSSMMDEDDMDADGDEADGVEKNGMMWGMPTEQYRALSARERKRVRNRISARTFRARRKEHLTVLESDLADRNSLIKHTQEENKALREEVMELRRRLAEYERPKPYDRPTGRS